MPWGAVTSSASDASALAGEPVSLASAPGECLESEEGSFKTVSGEALGGGRARIYLWACAQSLAGPGTGEDRYPAMISPGKSSSQRVLK